MVIIKRDDCISFLNSTGVKMPTTPVTNEISLQPPGNGNLIPLNNNNNASNIATIKRDSSQQQLQQLQAYTQQQQNQQQMQNQQQQPNNNQQLFAKAQLICRPNSHPFPVLEKTFVTQPTQNIDFVIFISKFLESHTSARAKEAS